MVSICRLLLRDIWTKILSALIGLYPVDDSRVHVAGMIGEVARPEPSKSWE